MSKVKILEEDELHYVIRDKKGRVFYLIKKEDEEIEEVE